METGPDRVVVIGDVMLDILVRGEGPIAHGSDRRAHIVFREGGSAANQAVWLAHFGVAVDFVARVGATDVERQGDLLRAAGVTPWLASDASRETGRLVALIDATGERSFLTDRGANEALSPADVAATPLAGARLLHLSGYSFFAPAPRVAVLDAMARAKILGVPVSVDPASAGFLAEVGPQQFLDWTRGAAVIFPNADEALLLTGTAEPAEQMARLASLYPLAIVKRGAAGAEAACGAARWSVAAPKANVLDTTGAGDAFIAAFLAAWLRGETQGACLSAGVEAGTRAAQIEGGRPVPTI